MADIEVFFAIGADVVTVFEDRSFLVKVLELPLGVVDGLVRSRSGDDAVVFVEDDDEASTLPTSKVVGVSSKADSRIEIVSLDNRTAHVDAGKIDASHVIAV